MPKYAFTFVAHDERDNFTCVVTAESAKAAWAKGLPPPMRPLPWKTWVLELVDDDALETVEGVEK